MTCLSLFTLSGSCPRTHGKYPGIILWCTLQSSPLLQHHASHIPAAGEPQILISACSAQWECHWLLGLHGQQKNDLREKLVGEGGASTQLPPLSGLQPCDNHCSMPAQLFYIFCPDFMVIYTTTIYSIIASTESPSPFIFKWWQHILFFFFLNHWVVF